MKFDLAECKFIICKKWILPRRWSINRDFKIQRRGRQREHQKNNWFNKQNNNFARAPRLFVHFFPVFARLRRNYA